MSRVVFSSKHLPPHLDERARYKLWTDLFREHMCAADISFFSEQPFYSQSEFMKFGEVRVTQLNANVQTAVRSAKHIAADSRNDCIIGAMYNGASSLLKQNGREAVRRPGQLMLYTNAEPLAAEHDSIIRFRGVCVPAGLLSERVPGFQDLTIKPLVPSPALRHLERYLSILVESEIDPAMEVLAETYLVDLIALALGASGDSAELARQRGLRVARLQEIISEINRGFDDGAVSARTVADGLGLSTRYINDLLHESGQSFTERVLELRLQKAFALLSDPVQSRMRIGEIALACGFNEVSYFNRCFRRRFGITPTQCRGGDR